MVITLNWYQEPYEYISREEFNELLDSLRADPALEEIPKTDIRRFCFFDNTFQVITLSKTASEIRVRKDFGKGIENVQEAMKPLYTTGGSERSGMGFTIMESFMDKLRVRSEPGKGTTVVMQRAIRLRVGRR